MKTASQELEMHQRRPESDQDGQSQASANSRLLGPGERLGGSSRSLAAAQGLASSPSCSTSGLGTEALATQRSVSRSMLELDTAGRPGPFQVSWHDVSSSYERPASGWRRLWPPASAAKTGAQTGAKTASEAELGPSSRRANVLQHLSGSFRNNQLVAVVGPSGCGKTSLLELLSGNSRQRLAGQQLRIRGLAEPRVAFIGQHDCLLPGLSARETLEYASRLQHSAWAAAAAPGQPRRAFSHAQHVLPVLQELGLAECAERDVARLSGGQAKRVTIGQELLYPCNVLLLDELTSGLDAASSYAIVRMLKRLVSNHDYPMSIVMSIHQPSARLFAQFDRVYVLSSLGACIYEGPSQPEGLRAHLGRFGLHCPKYHNMADYLIELATHDDPFRCGAEAGGQGAPAEAAGAPPGGQHLLLAHERTRGRRDSFRFDHHDDDHHHHQGHALHEAIERARSNRKRPLWTHLAVHTSRSMLRIRRSAILTYLQLITYLCLGLQLATFYGPDIGSLSGCPQLPGSLLSFALGPPETGAGSGSELRRIQENVNFLLVAVMTVTFAALEITVITFPLEAKTVQREWRNGWYRVSAYFLGRTLADLPYQVGFVSLFSLLVYSLTGQPGLLGWRFGLFTLVMVLSALIAQSVGFIFGALFMHNLPAAVFTAPLCIFPALLFSGFFSRASQVPALYRPMTWISHFRYAFDCLLVALYGRGRCSCDQGSLDAHFEQARNQTPALRDTFRMLFGASEAASGECSSAAPPAAGAAAGPTDEALAERLLASALADNATLAPAAPGAPADAFEQLSDRLAAKLAGLLESQANYGRPLGRSCDQHSSYLVAEFELSDGDLLKGLLALLFFVLASRLACHVILRVTMSSRPLN